MRPRTVSDRQAMRIWRSLKRPTGREFAEALGVSQRTAWRYIRELGRTETCPTCHGCGRVRADRGGA